MGAQEGFEAPTLIGVSETEQHDGVLTDVGVNVKKDFRARGPESAEDRRRHGGPVADAPYFDDDFTRERAVDECSPQ
jgi:hypothetical protein